ncbi:MAG: YybH family protein [Pyrinomonadaceae bacterium]
MKKLALLTVLIFTIAIAAAAQQKANSKLTLENGVKPHVGIDAIYAEFSEAYDKLDAKMVTDLYTDDALYLTPESGIQRGRDVIISNFKPFFDSIRNNGGKLDIAFHIVERRVSGNMGYDVGTFSLTSTGKSGATQTSKGKFVVIALKMKNGRWKFQLDSYSDMPKGM